MKMVGVLMFVLCVVQYGVFVKAVSTDEGITEFLMFSTKRSIRAIPLDGSQAVHVDAMKSINGQTKTRSGNSFVAIDYEARRQEIYFSDIYNKAIFSSTLNISNIRPVMAKYVESVEGISLDWISRNLYYTDFHTRTVSVMRLDNPDQRRILLKDLGSPRSIVVHPAKGYVFFADWLKDPFIGRCEGDGSNMTEIHRYELGQPNGLCVDYDTDRIYWVDAYFDRLHHSELDGNDLQTVPGIKLVHPFGVSVFKDNIYLSDWKLQTIYRMGKTSGEITPLLTGVQFLRSVRVYSEELQKIPENHPCARNNGGCSHFCFPVPPSTSGGRVPERRCGCPFGFKLSGNATDCEVDPSETIEIGCNSSSMFQCKTGRCIAAFRQCDGYDDCMDNSDELACDPEKICSPDKFQCTNGKCVSFHWKCDGENDCGDMSDETNCYPVGHKPINIRPYPTANVTEGGSITFTCTLVDDFGACPSEAIFEWFLNKHTALVLAWQDNQCFLFDGDATLPYTCGTVQSMCQTTLTLTQVKMSQHDDLWKCAICGIDIASRIFVPITTVDVTSPVSSQIIVSEYSPSSFVCETSAGRPQATIQWYKQLGTNDPVYIPGGTITTTPSGTSVITRSTLQYSPTRCDHDYRVYCTAYNIDESFRNTSNNTLQLYVKSTDLKNCGILYMKPQQYQIGETLQLTYFPDKTTVDNPGKFYRIWKVRNDTCAVDNGCEVKEEDGVYEFRTGSFYGFPEYQLIIKSLYHRTTGDYVVECISNTTTLPINVQIPVRPSTPVFTEEENTQFCQRCLVGKILSNYEIKCETYTGTSPEVKIYVNGQKQNVSTGNGNYTSTIWLTENLHNATVKCEVTNAALETPLYVNAILYVAKQPGSPKVIMGELKEGYPANVSCTSSGGRPPASLKFQDVETGDNLSISIADRHEDNGAVSLIHLNDVNITWDGKRIKCCAYHYAFMEECTGVEVITFKFPPKEVYVDPPSPITTLQEEYALVISCRMLTFNTQCLPTWQLDGETFNLTVHDSVNNTNATYSDIYTQNVTVRLTQSDNGKLLKCVARCTEFPDSKVEGSWTVSVPYGPELSFGLDSDIIVLNVGESLNVTCLVKSVPAADVFWRRELDGADMPSSKCGPNAWCMKLQRVTTNQCGVYTCTMKNALSGYISKSLFVIVNGPVSDMKTTVVVGASVASLLMGFALAIGTLYLLYRFKIVAIQRRRAQSENIGSSPENITTGSRVVSSESIQLQQMCLTETPTSDGHEDEPHSLTPEVCADIQDTAIDVEYDEACEIIQDERDFVRHVMRRNRIRTKADLKPDEVLDVFIEESFFGEVTNICVRNIKEHKHTSEKNENIIDEAAKSPGRYIILKKSLVKTGQRELLTHLESMEKTIHDEMKEHR